MRLDFWQGVRQKAWPDTTVTGHDRREYRISIRRIEVREDACLFRQLSMSSAMFESWQALEIAHRGSARFSNPRFRASAPGHSVQSRTRPGPRKRTSGRRPLADFRRIEDAAVSVHRPLRRRAHEIGWFGARRQIRWTQESLACSSTRNRRRQKQCDDVSPNCIRIALIRVYVLQAGAPGQEPSVRAHSGLSIRRLPGRARSQDAYRRGNWTWRRHLRGLQSTVSIDDAP